MTDFGDDVSPSLVRGLDGSLSAAFVNTQWRLAEIRLTRPLARAIPRSSTSRAPARSSTPAAPRSS